MQSPQVVTNVIETIFDSVNLRFVDKTTVNETTVLGQGGLGLDSVDILEVVVAIEHRFGVKLQDKKSGVEAFQSVGTIAKFVESNTGATH